MKTRFRTVAMATAFLAALGTSGFAGDNAKVDDHDEQFIKTAAAGSKAEAKIAELAAKKAQSADVKELADMLVTDHTALVSDLTALAGKKGVDLSAVIEPKAAETFQNLESYSGKDFDKSFLKDMKSDHEKAISNFESEDKKVKDPDVKAFIEKALPGIRRHLDKIESLLSKE